MLTQRHSATTDRPVAAAEGRPGCSRQQAAAAWAWFEHGHGSTSCITPSKGEGLMAAKRNAKCNIAGPSRFKKELDLSRTAIFPQQSAGRRSDDAIAKGHAGQRHSFHDDDLDKLWRFSRSCRRAPTSPHFSKLDEGPADQDEAEDEEGGFQVDDETSSLLDKCEVDALYRQLHEHLISSSGNTLCSPSSTTCSAELQKNYEAQKAHHVHPGQAHIKPRGYFQSSNRHKPLAGATLWETDTEHHQNINDLVHRPFRLRIRSTAPAFCRSIATADSIVDHRHHPASVLPLNKTTKRQETIHDQSNIWQKTGRVSIDSGESKRIYILKTADEASGDAGQHERAEFASSHRTSHQKMRGRSDLELVGGAPPSRLHHSDLLYSKVLQPPMSSRLPDMTVGHNMGGASLTDEYGVACTNQHRHFHKHHHIHHHHHHYHHLQHIHQASQDTVLMDHLIAKKVHGAHVLQYPLKALQGGDHDP